MKRVFLFLAGVVGLSVLVYVGGQVFAQGPAGTPPAAGAVPAATARADKPRVAVFNTAKLMKDFTKWQYYSAMMHNRRVEASAELARLKKDIVTMTELAGKEPVQAKKDELVKTIVAKQREFEDKEDGYRKTLDAESSKYLKELYSDVQAAVQGMVETNGYDVVFAYQDAVTAEELNNPMLIDMKMRSPTAMPFYVSKNCDITQMMVDTLNQYRKAPGAVPPMLPIPETGVKAAGATAPR